MAGSLPIQDRVTDDAMAGLTSVLAGFARRVRTLPLPGLLVASVLTAILLGAPTPNPRLVDPSPALQRELSWEGVILDAIAHRARFGVDVIYTFGPLADLYIDQFHPSVWPRAVAAKLCALLVVGVESWLLMTALPGSRVRRSLACLALALPASQMNNTLVPDGLYVTLLSLSQLVYIVRPSPATYLAAAVAGASLSLAKFSFAALYGCTVMLPLLVDDRRRRAMGLMACGAALLPLIWIACGQHPRDLPAYLATSAELARNYDQAMWRPSDVMSVQVPLGGVLIVAVTLFGWTLPIPASTRRAPVVLVLAAAGVIVYKSGFTRHDVHVWIPFVWLASVGAATMLLARSPRALRAAFALGFAFFAVHVAGTIGAPYAVSAQAAARQWERVRGLVTPATTYRRASIAYAGELARIRALPLSALVRAWRPADVDAANQLPALVDGSRRPTLRPVFQSVAAYSPGLAERNRRYLAALPTGATVIVESWSIDHRHAGLQQSGSWRTLLSDFSVVEEAPPYVVLRKHEPMPLACSTSHAAGTMGGYTAVPAPPDGAIVIASVAPTYTLWGRVRRLVLRDEGMQVATRTDAAIDNARFVAGMGAAGFLAVPSVGDGGHLGAVWDGTARRRAIAIGLRPLGSGSGFSTSLTWRFETCRRLP